LAAVHHIHKSNAAANSKNVVLCRKFISNVFGLGSVAYWMDAARLCSLREKWFSPETTSQWRLRWARPTSKRVGQSYESADAFSDSLAQSFQTLWPIIASCAKLLAGAGLKRYLKRKALTFAVTRG